MYMREACDAVEDPAEAEKRRLKDLLASWRAAQSGARPAARCAPRAQGCRECGGRRAVRLRRCGAGPGGPPDVGPVRGAQPARQPAAAADAPGAELCAVGPLAARLPHRVRQPGLPGADPVRSCCRAAVCRPLSCATLPHCDGRKS